MHWSNWYNVLLQERLMEVILTENANKHTADCQLFGVRIMDYGL
jgi:hypothetical protein